MTLFQCPCCDYFSLKDRGEYSICKLCFWEDDGRNPDQLDVYSGPNHMTLREGRHNFQAFGACDRRMLKSVLPATERARFAHQSRA
ncbi:CPCC family cysteine-rich protein [Comamonas aquatilis]|uniref:CPCC family cysteine-rich protein n=1 Tax=Comamonas aquatilis TaxID=1778406 RepID=UPI0039EFC5F5